LVKAKIPSKTKNINMKTMAKFCQAHLKIIFKNIYFFKNIQESGGLSAGVSRGLN
jgi:hypothetical protein